MGLKKRIIKNTLSVQAGDVGTRIITFLFGIFVARKLPLDAFGSWILVFTFLKLFDLFTELGVGKVAIREIPRDPGSANKYLVNLFLIKSAIGVIASGLLLGVIWIFKYPPQTTQLLYFAIPLLFIGTLKKPIVVTLMGLEKMTITAGFKMGSSCLYVILGMISLWCGYGVLGLLWIAIICECLSLVLMINIFQRYIFKIQWEFNRSVCIYLLKSGWVFAINDIMRLILYRLDHLFLSKMKGIDAVAIYGAAYRLFEPTNYAVRGVRVALMPTLSGLYDGYQEKVKLIHESLLKFVLIIIPPLVFLVTIFSKELILLIYGKKFLPSADVCSILGWTVGILFITTPMKSVLSVSPEFPKFVMGRVVGAVLNIILNLLLIPKWSCVGAAMATFICVFLELPWSLYMINRIWNCKQSIILLGKGGGAIAVMVSLYLLTRGYNPYISAGLSVGVYFFIIKSLGMLDILNLLKSKVAKKLPKDKKEKIYSDYDINNEF